MPLYRYENEKGEHIYVLRTMEDYAVPPTEEEVEHAGKEQGEWKRVLEPPRTTGKEHWRNKGGW